MTCNAPSMRSVRTLRAFSVSTMAAAEPGFAPVPYRRVLPYRHCDVLPDLRHDEFPRRISVVLFLTSAGEPCEGGALRSLTGRTRSTSRRKAGTLVAFPSDVPVHQALPVDCRCTGRGRRLVLLCGSGVWANAERSALYGNVALRFRRGVNAAEGAASIHRQPFLLVLSTWFEPSQRAATDVRTLVVSTSSKCSIRINRRRQSSYHAYASCLRLLPHGRIVSGAAAEVSFVADAAMISTQLVSRSSTAISSFNAFAASPREPGTVSTAGSGKPMRFRATTASGTALSLRRSPDVSS